MLLLGMTGPIGHGKTTFADALAMAEPTTRHFETFSVIAEIVDQLHQALGPTIPSAHDLAAINDWLSHLPTILRINLNQHTTFDKLKLTEAAITANPLEYEKLFEHLNLLATQPELARQRITAANKAVYRPILQWIGGYLVAKVDPGIWWQETIRRMRLAAHDGAKVCVAGALRYPHEADLLRAAGGKVIKIIRPDQTEKDANDPTENHRSVIEPDIIIVNNGRLTELDAIAQRLLADILAGRPKNLYSATKSV